jgi:hypothetical protein
LEQNVAANIVPERSHLKAERLCLLAQEIAIRTPRFFETKGAGDGDRATALFMSQLRMAAQGSFGQDCSEAPVCRKAKLAFDFYFRDEETVVEVALGLRNPNSEFEHDIFKCLLGIEEGLPIKRLLFLAKPGAISRQSSPGSKAIAEYMQRHHGIEIEILELEPGPERERSPS